MEDKVPLNVEAKIYIFLGIIVLTAFGFIGYKYYDTTQQTLSSMDSSITKLQKDKFDKENAEIKKANDKILEKRKQEQKNKEEQARREKEIEESKYLKGYGKKYYRFYIDVDKNYLPIFYYYDKETIVYYDDKDIDVYVKFVVTNQLGNLIELNPQKFTLNCNQYNQLKINGQYFKDAWYERLMQVLCK